MINPNDLIHGDHNGVTTIPIDIAADVADVADDFIAAEGVMLEWAQSDDPSKEKCHAARDEFQNCINKIKEQIAGK